MARRRAAHPAAVRDAIDAGDGTIQFDCGGPVTLAGDSNGTYLVTGNVTIEGLDIRTGGQITFSGEDHLQVFYVLAGGSLTLNNVVVTNGFVDGDGGGILNYGALTLNRTTVQNSHAGGAGGGIAMMDGTLVLENSTIDGNDASSGGGLYMSSGDSVVRNSTVSGNRAGSSAGGIRFAMPQGAASATLTHVTIYNNVVNVNNQSTNADLYVDAESQAPSIGSSIIAGSAGGDTCFVGTALDSQGYNLASDASCGLTATGDQQNKDPLLAALADNGGATRTHLPFVGSPAVDAIPSEQCQAILTDQRGLPRPQGVNCDVGAVEDIPTTPPPVTVQKPYYLDKLFIRPILDFPVFLFKTNIKADQLEVTQGIQEADGQGVTLVAGKRTYVRLHVRKTAGAADPIVGARLWRVVNGGRVGDPLLPSHRVGLVYMLPFRLGGGTYVYDPTITVRSQP